MSPTVTAAKRVNPWWVALVCGMASYIDACAIVSNGIALVIYQHSIGITGDQIGLLSAVLTVGIGVGALTGGRLGDRFGRRSVFIVTMFMIMVGAILMAIATSFVPLLAGTILVGLGTGADLPVSLATIAEAATDENRGKLLGFSQIMWVAGILGALGVSTIVGGMGRLGGQIMFGQIAVVALLTLIGRLGIPESDNWQTAHAERLAGAETIRAERASIKDLFVKPYIAPFIALLIFYPLTNLGANTGGQFTTYLWVNVIGTSVQFSSLVGLLGFPIGFLWAYWFMRIVDTPKRFLYFQIGAVALLLQYLIPAILGFSVVTMIIATLFGGFGSAFAFEAIMKVWAQESFPTLIRTTAQGTIISVARFLAAGLASVTPGLIDHGPRQLYFGLAALCFIGLAAAWVVFRKDVINEFDVEDQIDEQAHAAHLAGH